MGKLSANQVQGAMAIASGAYQCKVTKCKIIDPVETYHICFDEAWWEKFLKRLKVDFEKGGEVDGQQNDGVA